MKKLFEIYAVCCCLFLAGSPAAHAGDVKINVTDAKGLPVEFAVVSLKPLFVGEVNFTPTQDPVMQQKGSLFSPFVLAVHTGTSVAMPNLDNYRHHIYSFSKAKRFEQKLYSKDQSVDLLFDTTGKIALGCNIHDNMLAYIYVTDHPVFSVTRSDGTVTFAGLTDGLYEMHVWHPDVRRSSKSIPKVIEVGSTLVTETLQAKLRRVRRSQRPSAEDSYN